MIILARPVAYGGNAARYAMEKEDATVVKVNHMPDYLDATEIWYRMTQKLDFRCLTFVV